MSINSIFDINQADLLISIYRIIDIIYDLELNCAPKPVTLGIDILLYTSGQKKGYIILFHISL